MVSFKAAIFEFRWRISFTFLLVIIESFLAILFPLFIGFAINDLLEDKHDGVIYLAALGIARLIVGTTRRYYDTRTYARVYRRIVPRIVLSEQSKGSSTSKVAARAGLANEFIDFLEHRMPSLVDSVISVFGILIIVASLSLNVLYACIGLFVLIIVIYLTTGKLTYTLNVNYNNQLERQVDALASGNVNLISKYYRRLMRWNIRLSDLETFNYLLVWLGIISLYVYTPITLIGSGLLSYGLIFSVLVYVMDYINVIIVFPMYIQQFIRLREISRRLKQ